MIDILNQRVQINPNKEFVEYKNKNISYKQFNNIVNNISNDIKLHDLKNRYIGLKIIDNSFRKLENMRCILSGIDSSLIPFNWKYNGLCFIARSI